MDLLGTESIPVSRSSNSSFVLNYSSDDDDDYGGSQQHQQQQLDKTNKLQEYHDMNHDAFIELDLQATTDDDDDDDKEFEFRISFSALRVPFPPGFHPSSINPAANDHPKSQLTSAHNINDSAIPYDRSMLISSIAQQPVDNNDCVDVIINSWKLLQGSKASLSYATKIIKNSSGAANVGIMKLLVKMGSCMRSGLHVGLGSMGASLIQQRPCCRTSGNADDHTYNTSRIKFKPFDKWFTWALNTNMIGSSSPSTKVELVLDDQTRRNYLFGSCGVVTNPLSKKTKRGSKISSRRRGNESCPTSIKSSPVLHHQSGDTDLSLLHAAIAHCKKSFRGETHETHHFIF